ncbi:hypothetical protein C8J55DRAFT_491643 [Lentinula edodes]|uniref:Uncharacterized protein n=1 Tax=Lentinula lateritia TaxID=40482 RepID=A0A9W8ZZV8_9AGAR|nr:hypothetical protein C8J55DRAFT_491643 [Lentinula edodes]
MRHLISFFLFFGLTSIVWAAPRPVSNTPIYFELVPVSTTHSSWVKMETLEAQISRRGILARAEEKKGTYENPLRFEITFSTSTAFMLPGSTRVATAEDKQEIEQVIKEVFQSPAVWTTLGVVQIKSFEGNVVVGGLGQVVFDIRGDTNPTPCTHGTVWTVSKSFSITRMHGQPIHYAS